MTAGSSTLTHAIGDRAQRTIATEALRLSREAAVRSDGSIDVVIITPGWGSSGYYSAEVLERDGPRVFTSGLHMFLDHPGMTEMVDRPERTVRDLAAVLTSDARWDATGPDGPGLYATAEVLPSFRQLIDEIAPHIGVSIRAGGMFEWGEADGREGWIIQALIEAASVDFVTVPGRGGRVLEIMESAQRRAEEDRHMSDETIRAAQEAQRAAESRATAAETAAAAHEATIAQRDTRIAELEEEVARFREADILGRARGIVTARVAEVAEFPDVTRARLVESIAVNPPVRDGALDEAALGQRIEAAVLSEREYIASIRTTRVVDMGATEAAGGDDFDTAAKAFEALGMSPEKAKIAAAGR